MGTAARRIAFLAFHDAAQPWHYGPVLFELGRLEGVEVDVYTDGEVELVLRRIGTRYPPSPRLRFLRLPPTVASRLRAFVRRDPTTRVLPWAHLPRLAAEYDAIAVPCNYLRRRLGQLAARTPVGSRAAFVFVPHGGTAAAVPFAEGCDFALAYGPAMERGFAAVGKPCVEVGYPKLDLPRPPPERLFADERPVVLYNPHWRVASSWPAWGELVLDFFASSPDYNLVFAPHPNLFGRRADRSVLRRFRGIPNLHLDVDSPRLLDLTYATVADLYLGDASSQLYEVLALRKRPCVFLDPAGLSLGNRPDERRDRLGEFGLQPLLDGWKCGDGVTRIDDLPAVLSLALAEPRSHEAAQAAALADQFRLTDVPSGRRAAEALLGWARLRSR